MTLEERERRAYADGRVEDARLLGEAIDACNDKILDLDYEVRSHKEEVDRLERMMGECDCA